MSAYANAYALVKTSLKCVMHDTKKKKNTARKTDPGGEERCKVRAFFATRFFSRRFHLLFYVLHDEISESVASCSLVNSL